MKCLLVHAHPLDKSLTRHFLDTAHASLVAGGHDVELLDLYPAGFSPLLTAQERAGHYAAVHDRSTIEPEATQLENAQVLVLVFPTWWFGLPAMMKGWIDRILAPGVAFDQSENFGPIKGRLGNLCHVVVITTLGSPWWVDWLVLRRPVRRVLKTGVFGTCAPSARFRYLPFYASEQPGEKRVEQFRRRIDHVMRQL